MAKRNLLHRSHLEDFKVFLDHNDIDHRPGKGDWEVMQVQMDNGTWQAIYDRIGGDHYSIPNPLVKITEIFYKQRKQNGN